MLFIRNCNIILIIFQWELRLRRKHSTFICTYFPYSNSSKWFCERFLFSTLHIDLYEILIKCDIFCRSGSCDGIEADSKHSTL